MIENALNRIGGVGIFGVISIAIFFVLFVGMLFWAASLKKAYLCSMRGLPLEDEFVPSNEPAPLTGEANSSSAAQTQHRSGGELHE